MCGIAGCLGAHDAVGPAVVAQLRTLEHRGPDSVGTYERAGAAVGQTRLAIIDLVTGDPPITNEAGTIGVALNGEIYNYRELRDELRRRGSHLHTQGDTEVIAHLAEDDAPVALARRLHGMFAFALWDDERRRLVLGRDRLGKKPLYYWAGDGRFVFGSEIKAVLAHPAVPRRMDPDALSAYLTFGYVPTPRTFFEGVLSLPPGHVMTVEPGRAPVIDPYWAPQIPGADPVDRVDLSFDEAAAEVRRLLTEAVERRLIAHVPLGAFLSGGIDSSSVVGLMAALCGKPVSTFTIGFEDQQGFDERPYARMVAERWKTDHVEFVVKPDAAELIDRLVCHHDQPFGDSSALPTFLLSELTRAHVTVALCGDGGDELFAGYERFAAALIRHRLRRLPVPMLTGAKRAVDALSATRLRSRMGGLARLLSEPGQEVPRAYLSWISYTPAEWRDALLPGASDWGFEDYARIWEGSEGGAMLDRLLDLNLRTYLLDDLLPKVDRTSMAHGLEVRAPFLDTDLVEFALRLPESARVRGLSLKRVLKAAMADILPPEVVNRPKRGFGIPLDRWLRTDLRTYTEGMLCAPGARARRHLDPGAVDALVAEHQSGRASHGHTIWTLLTLEAFLRRHDW